jgi:hydroxyethylthiazole kinase-like uncharacterized protein yjeF
MAESTLLTAAQMRSWERAAIGSGAATGLDLMERAGRGAVDAILCEWAELAEAPHRAVVLCGPGNNGGDGFVVARLLAERGWAVDVFLLGDAERLPPDARTNHDRWTALGPVGRLSDNVAEIRKALSGRDDPLVVDAVFGTGLTRAAPAEVVECLDAASSLRTVALDLPSVLQSDSGRSLPAWHGDGSAARLTVAFGAYKQGHFVGDGPRLCGRLALVELGLPDRPVDEAAFLVRPPAGIAKATGHKYDHGHALVLAGTFGRTGAARLAARGALRIGAGLVTVAAPGAAMMECAAQLTAVMLRRCDDGDALREMLGDDRLNALALGPGLGTGDRARGLVDAALESGRRTVLDADALTILAGDGRLRDALHADVVLTPHAGEFARLCPDLADRLRAPDDPSYGRIEAARDAAARTGAVMLLKGPDTIIAEPGGRAAVNDGVYARAAPGLATAGAGDVLAGMIAGLLARGMPPFEAAGAAAWLQVEAARAFGPGLIAEDIPEALPGALAALEAPRPRPSGP